MPHGRLSAIKKDCPRPDDIPDWDFDYEQEQGINGTPIHHPTKKRQKQQIEIVPDHGPLQLYGVKRLSGNIQACMKPHDKNKKEIEQPCLPPSMNKKVVKEVNEVGEPKEEITMDGAKLMVPERPPPDSARIMDDELQKMTNK